MIPLEKEVAVQDLMTYIVNSTHLITESTYL